jgi:hypothetical protein
MIGESFEIVNNVIYNPAAEYAELHDVARTTSFSFINNLGIDGSNTSTTPDPALIRVADDQEDRGDGGSEIRGRVYASGNIDRVFRTTKGDAEDDAIDETQRDDVLTVPDEGSISFAAGAVFDTDTLSAALISRTALPAAVGASRPFRDALDTNVLNQVLAESGGSRKNDPTGVTGTGLTDGYPTLAGGTPETDTDGDGMPDSWELELDGNAFEVTRSNPWGDRNADGLSNLEEFLAFRAGDIPDPRI